jgi:hypothetical protein
LIDAIQDVDLEFDARSEYLELLGVGFRVGTDVRKQLLGLGPLRFVVFQERLPVSHTFEQRLVQLLPVLHCLGESQRRYPSLGEALEHLPVRVLPNLSIAEEASRCRFDFYDPYGQALDAALKSGGLACPFPGRLRQINVRGAHLVSGRHAPTAK